VFTEVANAFAALRETDAQGEVAETKEERARIASLLSEVRRNGECTALGDGKGETGERIPSQIKHLSRNNYKNHPAGFMSFNLHSARNKLDPALRALKQIYVEHIERILKGITQSKADGDLERIGEEVVFLAGEVMQTLLADMRYHDHDVIDSAKMVAAFETLAREMRDNFPGSTEAGIVAGDLVSLADQIDQPWVYEKAIGALHLSQESMHLRYKVRGLFGRRVRQAGYFLGDSVFEGGGEKTDSSMQAIITAASMSTEVVRMLYILPCYKRQFFLNLILPTHSTRQSPRSVTCWRQL
jgi:hypothetical protein